MFCEKIMNKKILIILFLFLIIFTIIGCLHEKKNKIEKLKIIKEYKLKLPEPSGLDFTYDGSAFWTVSDENNTVYKISLAGKILDKIKIEGNDLEGVSTIDDSRIAVILERDRKIIILNTTGKEIRRAKLPLSGKLNSGIEGITYNPKTHHFFVVNEKDPLLLLELDSNLSILKRKKINFVKDLSGLYFDEQNNNLWLISDKSKTVAICDTSGTLLKRYRVNIPQIEGIAIDRKKNKIYLVSDLKEKLYTLNMKTIQ